jgi:LysM repeat protein
LVPVLFAVVLASEGRFGASPGTPVANAPVATPVGRAEPTMTLAPTAVAATRTQVVVNPTPAVTGPASSATDARPAVVGTPSASPQVAGVTTRSAAPASADGGGPYRAYRVQPGDTVRFVADMYGVSAASVSQASGLQNADQLRVGQILTIPIQPGWLYRVQPGETLDQIAARTGMATELIVSASKLSSDAVYAGDVILIPDQSSARSK